MPLFREFSLLWSLVHTLIPFMLLFEPRLPQKKTNIIIAATMIPLTVFNMVLCVTLDNRVLGILMLLSLSLPSLIVFWLLAKHRDGRFFFTFCMVDTISLEILYLTMILNHYTTPESNVVLLVSRLIAYPLLEWFVYKLVRPDYLQIQHYTDFGWNTFTLIAAMIYILIPLAANVPTVITERPGSQPAVLLLFVLVPIIYLHIIQTVRRLHRMHERAEQENILRLQVNDMSVRLEELAAADERFREERHNYRHKMKAISSLIATRQFDELAALVEDYNAAYQRIRVVRYSRNAAIDATLSTYIKNAESRGIRVRIEPAFPDPIPVDETELATVFANAIENAIHACEKLPRNERYIEIRVLSRPRFMIQIANSFDGHVEFDENGIPVNRSEGHGFGTRSIAAFCHLHNAHYIFKAENGRFTLFLNF